MRLVRVVIIRKKMRKEEVGREGERENIEENDDVCLRVEREEGEKRRYDSK